MTGNDSRSNKKLIRENMFKKRSELNGKDALKFSKLISDKLCESKEFTKAKTIALYSSKGNEVSTKEIFSNAINLGKKVFFPKTCSETRALTFFEVLDLEDLIIGEFSIMEPKGDTEDTETKNIDLIIVPGLAFDKLGTRLGFGMGCYDTALAHYNGTIAGLSYEFQFVDTLPKESFDKPINLLITENNIHYFS